MTDGHRHHFHLPHWGWFLLAHVVLVSGFIGVSVWMPWQREQQIVEQIKSLGATVETKTTGPAWLRRLVGDERMKEIQVFERVIEVKLRATSVTDAQIAQVHWAGLRNLEDLYLSLTPVTDAGLIHLTGLKHIRRLHLYGTRVTDDGIKKLQKSLPDCLIIH